MRRTAEEAHRAVEVETRGLSVGAKGAERHSARLMIGDMR
jgi:hypothetical protein